jgi:phosphopantothenoylcysteine decarboxylase/phosphopantothenate--cysteine ligase
MARIILGVTGGIAAYKATSIIRQLTELGHEVKVIPTQNALRFIGSATLEALSHNSVEPDLYTDIADVKHVQLGQQADLVIVAPATAAFLARYATGLADDLLLNTLLVTKAPILIAPAMHTEMWQHPSTRANVELLRNRGVHVLDPAVGRLTGPDSGAGRLPEPEEIVSRALTLLDQNPEGIGYLKGKRVLITLGGTREPIDPVRFIGNASSGLMGIAFVRAALAAGASVSVLAANVAKPHDLSDVDWQEANTASQMHAETTHAARNADIVLMAAAVADFSPKSVAATKIKKGSTSSELEIRLVENPDTLKGISSQRTPRQTIVGFAAETTAGDEHELVSIARQKLASKGCDLLLANDVSTDAKFGSESTTLHLISSGGDAAKFSGNKRRVASDTLRYIFGPTVSN